MIIDPVTPIQGVDDLVERDFGIQKYKSAFNTRNVKKSYPFEGSDEDNLDPGSHFNRDRKEESATRYFLRDRREILSLHLGGEETKVEALHLRIQT